MAMKKIKPKNDTIDAAGAAAVNVTKATTKALSATADAAEKLIIGAFKASVDPLKFLKQHLNGKAKAGSMASKINPTPKPPKKAPKGAIPLKKK